LEIRMKQLFALTALALMLAAPVPGRAAAPVNIVAAENFYGDVARQIGGPDVNVTSILDNPDQDPHLFEASASVARAVSAARVVIYSGIDYDPWMARLLRAARGSGRTVIVVADLMGRKSGDNPHIWYDPATMRALAQSLADALADADPAHKPGYQKRLALFQQSLRPIDSKIAALRRRLANTPATATEPVFGYMFRALGMRVRDLPFQIAIMNGTEPSAADVAGFEDDLRLHRVRLLVYNSQASSPIAARMKALAAVSHVPVVGASETEPPGKTWQAWMLSELDAVDHALPR
jgi:zinc/manganese transport system substrate-binding protein